MLFKFILYCVLAYLTLRFIRWVLRPARPSPARGRGAPRARSSQMVRCDVCGMFITKSSALMVGGSDFCSRACYERKVHRA
ncbi:MAG: PP0621 family protein [Blastocatellia bacterium]